MKRLLVIGGVCALLGMVLVGFEVARSMKQGFQQAKLASAESKAFSRFWSALSVRDYARIHADLAPALRAAMTEADVAARFEAFQKTHGRVAPGFSMSDRKGIRWNPTRFEVEFAPERTYTVNFEKAKNVPFEFTVEPEGDQHRFAKLALKTPTDPLELPAPATATAAAKAGS